MVDTNKGFIQHGGTIKAEVFAGGENARAYKSEDQTGSRAQLEDVYRKLEELENAIRQHGAPLHQPDEIVDAAKAIRSQLQSEKPNKLTVMSILNGIAQSVKSVASIATIAESIKTAVTGLL
jgi:hypothetical protein